MSVQAMSWVIEHSPHKGSELLCLIMIANYAHADGTGAYPSASRLGKDLRMSTRQAIRLVDRLEASGAIRIEPGKGPHGTHLMTVVMDANAPQLDEPIAFTTDKMSGRRARRTTDKMSVPTTDKMSGDKMAAPDKLSTGPLTNCPLTPDIAMSDKPSLRTISKNRQGVNDGEVERAACAPSSMTPDDFPIVHGDEPRPDMPHDLVVVLAEHYGREPHTLEPDFAKRQHGLAKALLQQGHTADKVRRCLVYLGSQAWRDSPPDLVTVKAEIGKWELAGEPPAAQMRASPNGKRQRNQPDYSGIEEFNRRMDALQPERR